MAGRKFTPYNRTHAGGLGGGAQRCPLQARRRGQEYLPFMKGCSTCAQETYVACAVSCQDPESWPGKCQSTNKCMHTGSALRGCGWDMTCSVRTLRTGQHKCPNAKRLTCLPSNLYYISLFNTALSFSTLLSSPGVWPSQLTYSQALSETQEQFPIDFPQELTLDLCE